LAIRGEGSRSLDTLIELTNGAHRLALSTIVLYESLRGREIDLAVAACAVANGAAIWTLNPGNFRDIPGLRLI